MLLFQGSTRFLPRSLKTVKLYSFVETHLVNPPEIDKNQGGTGITQKPSIDQKPAILCQWYGKFPALHLRHLSHPDPTDDSYDLSQRPHST